MNRRFAETAVGAVVVAIAAWFLVFAYNSGDFRPVAGYALSAKFNSVGGLAPGNDVRIGGVKIGSVLDQRIDAADFRAVIVFTVRSDLERFLRRLAPENDDYEHDAEGPDDMPSHLRMALTRTSEVIPVMNGRLALGTWQGIFLFEHRRAPHTREIVVSVVGE
mgnify:CR=1 FL=1